MKRGRNDGIAGAAVRTSRSAGRIGVASSVAGETSDRTNGSNHATGAAGLLGLLVVAGLLVLVAGCQVDTGVMPPNQPPVTYLSVLSTLPGSALDTLGYQQILHWWGSDRDGRVEAYLIKWDSGWTPPDSARRWEGDPSWIVTTATTDTFALATYGTADPAWLNPDSLCSPMYGRHTFSVRALDNDGASDPVGKTQTFNVANNPPMLEWSRSFSRPDTSLPAVAFAWHPLDRDGPGTVRSFVYWLTREGKAAADSFFTADTLVALVPTAFGPAGSPEPGTWTLHVLAIDGSRTRSVPISHTWTVGLPHGHYLLIDNASSNCPGNGPGNGSFDEIEDRFFRSVMNTVAPNDYHIMDIEAQGGFRTGVEVGPFLSLFKGVLWYSGMPEAANDAKLAGNLSLADRSNGLRDYLSGGGRLVLCAHNAVGDSAALSRTFQFQVLGIANWYRQSDRTSQHPEYINGNIMLPTNSTVLTAIEGQSDSLLTKGDMSNVDFLILAQAQDITPVFTVAPGFLIGTTPPGELGWHFTPDDQTTVPAALGVLSQWGGRGGRMAVSSLLPSRADGFQSRARVMTALLRRALVD